MSFSLRSAWLVPVPALVLVLALGSLAPPARAAERVLVHGGSIRLNDASAGLGASGTVVEALLVEDGRVRKVGTLAELEAEAAAAGARRLDLHGATAVPGLQDAHGHLESYGESLEQLDLRAVEGFDELVARVARAAAELPAGAWVRGRGWDQTLWPGGEFPTHAALSEAVPSHPVLLERVDGHAALVNAKALELAGLKDAKALPRRVEGGEILRDEAGSPTGVLLDRAVELVLPFVPPPTAADLRRRILRAQAALLKLGLTCVHDMGVTPQALSVLRELEQEGLLRLRVIAYLWGNDELDEKLLARLRSGGPDARLSVAGLKLMADGALGSRGAALLEDYSDRPGWRGHLLLSEKELGRRLALCGRYGLQPAVHAIGDRANRVVLDLIDQLEALDAGYRTLRPRIEHAQVLAPKDWPRFPRLGVVPSMQPVHATSDMAWIEKRLGSVRSRGTYVWRTLAGDLGALAFGSDFPVETPDPLRGLYAARTRQDDRGLPAEGFQPEERLDGAAALAGYTSGAAYAVHQEELRGRLLPGFAADLTIVSVDPVTCPPAALLEARALATMIDGELVWEAGPGER